MPPIARHSARNIPLALLLGFVLLLYAGLATLLFGPWLKTLHRWEYLIPINSVLASAGCFFLSRRWLASVDASAVAGAVYGFGPYLLSFQLYHPLAGLSVAILPWLFCPAALWKRYAPWTVLRPLQRLILLLLPFAAIILFFWLPAQPWAGPYNLMPRSQEIQMADLLPLIGLPDRQAGHIILGLYPTAFIASVMGLFVYLALLRISVLIPVLAGIVLSFLPPVLAVPPIIWAAIPMLFLAVLGGLGAQAFAWGGASDRKWILICTSMALLLAGVCLLRITMGRAGANLRLSAGMYGLAALTTGIIFFIARGQLRWHLFRWILIGGAIGVDVFFSGRLILASLS